MSVQPESFEIEISSSFDSIDTYASGLQSQMAREIQIQFDESQSKLGFESLRTLEIRLANKLPKTLGFTFPESPLWKQKIESQQSSPSKQSKTKEGGEGCSKIAKRKSNPTRLTPPKDLVKLEDRLYYLLQPPLESLVSSANLEFPFDPFPYQLEGIAFLFTRAAAILADEMGLGKTMQAITTIRMLLLSGELSEVLLICPKPLVTNWVREFKLWAPEIPVAIIEGDAAKREFIWRTPNAPVKIANYELMMRDEAIVIDSGLSFDLVVLDEAQRIKNRNSTTSQIVRNIDRRRSWALTGTPIENSSDDLVSIFEFLSPGYLSDNMQIKSMSNATRDYIMRRTKDKVLTEMPPKLYRDAELDLTSQQWDSYYAAEDSGIVHLEDMGTDLTIQHVFELVLRLKQICNFDPRTGSSCKLERLEADLEEVAASGQKAIVFSQWVSAIDRMSAKLERFNPLEYHGRVPSSKRDAVLSQFKEDPKSHVILMSYGAGAVGLNLQFCRYVFLFDRWWNPAIEDQAINRAHRLGAAGSVTVTRMMAMNTIEERIHNVLEEKRQLFNSLFDHEGAPRQQGLSQKEIFGLFNLNVPNSKKAA